MTLSFMRRAAACFILLLIPVAAGCAPPPSMIATLTMLPGTPTPRPPTPYPSRTPRFTSTATVQFSLQDATPIPPKDCPAGQYDTGLPEDPSRMAGRSYDINHLPAGFTLRGHGDLEDPDFRWVWVKWEERSLYWIERKTCVNPAGRAYWQIVDALALPRLAQALGEAETMDCYEGQKRLTNVIAYGIFDPSAPPELSPDAMLRGRLLKVQGAYEMKAGFTPLDPSGLICVVTG